VGLWPFAFENASLPRLAGFEEALVAALGEAAHRRGAFQLSAGPGGRAEACERALPGGAPIHTQAQLHFHAPGRGSLRSGIHRRGGGRG